MCFSRLYLSSIHLHHLEIKSIGDAAEANFSLIYLHYLDWNLTSYTRKILDDADELRIL